MLENIKIKKLLEQFGSLNKEELLWVNGYLNGLASKDEKAQGLAFQNGTPKKITIAYGTETGNSKRVASEFAAKAKSQGIHAKVQSLEQYRLTDLNNEEYFLAVISTHGDGEPPIAAKKFYEHVHSTSAKLEKMKFSILALGDTSYPLFCKAGEDVDKQLNKLGAHRLAPLQKCDIDYDSEVQEWIGRILSNLKGVDSKDKQLTPEVEKKRNRKEVYKRDILKHTNLNDTGSNKETYHIEIEAEGIQYFPGDSIGIIPKNDDHTVRKILEIAGIDGRANVENNGALVSIQDLLTYKLNISHMPERIVKKYSDIIQQEIPTTKMDLLDLLKIYPVNDKKQFLQVLDILEKITPRLYSISSSPNFHEGELHITVARNSFKADNQTKFGICSNYLSFLIDGQLEFYVHQNANFRLPDEDKNVIMIGPGTGIAPFRSFLSERDITGASGKNWLFFGDQHFVSDFLYQTEIQGWLETGVLTKVDLAFSRDQEEKIYVQNRIRENSKEFFEWLDTGAYLFICGSKNPMSVDVEKEIIELIMKEGERSRNDAQIYLDTLKEDGRYILDVY